MLNKMFLAALLAIAFASCQNSHKQKANEATESHPIFPNYPILKRWKAEA